MSSERIGTHSQSIVAFRALVAIPSANPSMGSTLEVVGLEEQGFLLRLTDPMGAPVWDVELVGEGAEPLSALMESLEP